MDGSLCEAVLPIHGGKVEAIPGIWDIGATDGMVLVASASGQDETLEQGDVVAEVRQGLVESAVCSSCGLMDRRETGLVRVVELLSQHPSICVRVVVTRSRPFNYRAADRARRRFQVRVLVFFARLLRFLCSASGTI